MFGRKPDFLHVIKLLRLPGEAVVLPLLHRDGSSGGGTEGPQVSTKAFHSQLSPHTPTGLLCPACELETQLFISYTAEPTKLPPQLLQTRLHVGRALTWVSQTLVVMICSRSC